MRKASLALLITAFAIAPAVLSGQNNPRDALRLITALGVEPGMTVAEIGAGTGDLTVLLAQRVGAAGKFYPTEISEQRLADIRKAVAAANLTHVTVLQAGAESTNLSPGCCDAIFMRNVYHHFQQPAPVNASVFASLKPGGRLAIIDFPPGNGTEAASPSGRSSDGTHGVTKETVAKELEAAGFIRVIVEEPGDRQEGFLVVVRKPS